MKLPNSKKKFLIYLLFFFVFIIGSFFRFYNLNWDEGHFFHPDERNIAAAVSRIRFFDNLNPEFFAYGSLPIYVFRLSGEVASYFTKNPDWTSDWALINLISRFYSTLASSATIIVFFFFLKKYFSLPLAILSCFFMAFSPSLVQIAHYGVTESLLIFFLSLILSFSFQIQEKPKIGNYLKVGFICGLALATKISSLAFLVIPLMAHLSVNIKLTKKHVSFLMLILYAFITFAVFSPYAFLSHEKFFESMDYESGVVSGRLKVPYVLQFEKTLPYLFQIKNFLWQIGLTAIPGILGFFFLIISFIKTKDKKTILLLVFPVLYFLYVGSWFTKFIRYMTPFLPFLVIFGSYFLLFIQKRFSKIGSILIAFFLLASFVWALAFFSIYTRESTRITASKWIFQNIPKNAKVLTEHWDDGLPLPLTSGSPSWYQSEQLTIYEQDNPQKITYYSQKLADSDYLIINSRRLYGTLINLLGKYPITSRYYKLLFSGQLGYIKIAEFTSYPKIFNFEINDDTSEETFQVYDHPKVLIFKNQNQLSQQKLYDLLK